MFFEQRQGCHLRSSHLVLSSSVANPVVDTSKRKYLANAYRVLLTRARQGMVIYIPKGDESDHTRPPSFYDGTALYLQECGLKYLEQLRLPSTGDSATVIPANVATV